VRAKINPHRTLKESEMRAEDVVGLVIGLAVVIIALSLYIGLIVLGVRMAKRKNRSPHWFWFAVHPMGLIITLGSRVANSI
jgi:hypothetical protein